MSDVKDVAARAAQSKADKSDVLHKLLNKKRKAREVTITVDGEDLTLKFEALSAHNLDKLRAAHPPTVEQKANGFNVNTSTFSPALIAACMVEPEITPEQAKEMWDSEHWSTGELTYLFDVCSALCLEGIDIPRNASA